MIKMYLSNNRSSRNAKKFFSDYHIPVVLIQVNSGLSEKELIHILKKNPDELNSILSLRSKETKSLIERFDELRISDVIKILKNNPSLIKTPIIFDDRRFLAGFNRTDIQAFIPRKKH